jgi:hypothetical protein
VKLTGARAELPTRCGRRARRRHAQTVAPAFSPLATRPIGKAAHVLAVLACGTAHVHLYIWSVTAYRLAMLAFSPVASAAHAAGVAHADVVPFAWVSDVVRTETRYRVALESAARAGSISDAAASDCRDASAARVRVAIDCASDHVWAHGVRAVVVLESGNAADAATLNASECSYVRPVESIDGGYVAGRGGMPSVSFDRIADAVAYAAGAARRVTLPGETMPPSAPSHGNADPSLPSLADAFSVATARLRAIEETATASASARIASMRATIDAELARGY